MNMPSAEFSTSDTTPPHEAGSIGATVLMRALADEGVEVLWGYPGGAVLYIYDELYKQDKVQHVLVRHEQAAVHAADAYSRSTGKVGVCLVTSGPGVTNAVTGIATAYMDSIPMVIISGQVPTAAIGQDAFQECDTVGITRPCVKHNFLVKDVRELASTVKKAFFIARTGRPGPVLIDIPKDISKTPCQYEPVKTVSLRSYNPVTKGHSGQIREIYDLPGGGKRLMWPTQPMGETTTAADVDASGKVVAVRQVLQPSEFYKAQIGTWTKQDVLVHFGRPEETAYFPLMKREVWSYRYLENNVWYQLYHFYFDPEGILRLTQKTPDPLHEPERNRFGF